MYGRKKLGHDEPPSVVVNDLYVKGIAVGPSKAKPELVIDPNTVLPCTITS
jgi:hypothetical protein